MRSLFLCLYGAPLVPRRIATTLTTLVSCALLCALLGCTKDGVDLAPAPTRSPNIVFLLADDLGYSDLGCFGARDITTPAIDRLATEGATLTHCYASAPACTPTRAAFMTGRYPARCGLEGPISPSQRDVGLSSREPSVVRAIRSAGYTTGLIGKWHLGYAPHFHPNVHGFDEFFGLLGGQHDYFTHRGLEGLHDLWIQQTPTQVEGYSTDLFADQAVRFLRHHADERFFLMVAFNAVHAPFQNPANEDDVRDQDSWMQGERSDYIAMVERMDAAVSKILGTLDELNLRDNTVVVFTNDNGGESLARNAPLSLGKGDLHEGGIRVPGIVRWPGQVLPGSTVDQPIATHDLAATFLAAATTEAEGVDVEGLKLDGRDVRPLLRPEAAIEEHPLFWRIDRPDRNQLAVRLGPYKYLQIRAPATRPGGEEYLFDVTKDPAERVDLAADEPAKVAELRAAIAGWEAEMATESPRFQVK